MVNQKLVIEVCPSHHRLEVRDSVSGATLNRGAWYPIGVPCFYRHAESGIAYFALGEAIYKGDQAYNEVDLGRYVAL